MKERAVRLGCEVLLDEKPSWVRQRRLGLLCNQASVTSRFEHVANLVHRLGGRLCCLFAPQHGFQLEKQANMIESADGWEPFLNIPIVSLYGAVRQPEPDSLKRIDVLLVDLQDVGTRVYTYGVTMGLCMEAAGRLGVQVVVLDRPNPTGGIHMEGNLLAEDHRSFVGRYPIPMRHGLTLGEFARYIQGHCGVECDLRVIPMEGWQRSAFFPDTGLQWVFPSPNMPSWESALPYPGMVLLEGTNISEGRGTTLPFQIFGAPFIDQHKLGALLRDSAVEGALFRPISFEPMFDKWQGTVCHGFQIHVVDRERFQPYRCALVILQGLYLLHREHFRWLPPPYEYEREKLPIDILLGNGKLREELEKGTSVLALESSWQAELERYGNDRADSLLYE